MGMGISRGSDFAEINAIFYVCQNLKVQNFSPSETEEDRAACIKFSKRAGNLLPPLEWSYIYHISQLTSTVIHLYKYYVILQFISIRAP